MHGGIKVYRGTAAAARNYLDADRSRADDYYLAEGTGIARRFVAGGDGRVVELRSLTGDTYEAWVAGLDPESGAPRGRLRTDAAGVRFVELIVNGPKSWSLAAELHPDVAAAYEAAQDRSAEQIIQWLGQHATTRVGPRGVQVAVPVERLEAVTVRHYTSRAGDPHRHLHLQVNARVFAAGKWRGIDTVAVRDSIAALNGIGHATVMCDPEFRAALAAHGYTLNPDGEIDQLAEFVGPFSKRTAQIAALLDRYEAEWRRKHPGAEPGPGLRRAWDARAWAEDRPDKVIPQSGAELRQRWLDELAALGYRDRDRPVQLALQLPGNLNRDVGAADVVGRLGAGRSAWNAADVRGAVEQLLARTHVVADTAVRTELAEDLTARALALCVPLTDGATPEHIRSLTSPRVLDVEADLVTRLAARGTQPVTPATVGQLDGLDTGQRAAVAALASEAQLVVIEGAAGAGKTTTLAAAREALTERQRRMVVVTPTLKAAQAASTEIHTRAGSAAWLAWQHGWRWDASGTWTRIKSNPAPQAKMRRGDLLLVDEAGMLDQDTACALLTIADESGARVALIGDRHQLSAVGRGGMLDLARRWADAAACVDLEIVHRFTHPSTTTDGEPTRVPDPVYGVITLQMRQGDNPAAVFEVLDARDQVQLHGSEHDRRQAIADDVVAARPAGRTVAVVVDTLEQAAVLNTAIRDRLINAGFVDDRWTTNASGGQPVGVGDVVATRRNDHSLDVANRDTWTVTRIRADGGLVVTSSERGRRELPAEYVLQNVELAYATTAHGAQGSTATTAHLTLDDHTTAASAYVAMTRGREANVVHLVADDVEDAREQWVAAFARDRADLGVARAADLAARHAAGYAHARPPHNVLADLRDAWGEQAEQQRRLDHNRTLRERLAEVIALRAQRDQALAVLDTRQEQGRAVAEQARAQADRSAAAIERHAQQIRDQLLHQWNEQLEQAGDAARVVLAGPGRIGLRLVAVRRATETLASWSTEWQPYLPDMPTSTDRIAHYATWPPNQQRITEAFDRHARAQAERAHPEHHDLQRVAEETEQHWRETRRETIDLRDHYDAQLYGYGRLAHADDLDRRLNQADQQISDGRTHLDRVNHRLNRLALEPAVAAQPSGWLESEHEQWRAETAALMRIVELRNALAIDAAARERMHSHAHEQYPMQHDMGREGPSFGR
jgi:exodeoxyribonuclease V alpha subunit